MQNNFQRRAIFIYAVISCVITQSVEATSHESDRNIPTFTPIEPDLSLRSFIRTRMGMNGTEGNRRVGNEEEEQHVLASKSYQTLDGRQVKVYDDVLDFRVMSALQEYSMLISEWEFQNTSNGHHGPSPWAAPLDPEAFRTSAFISVVKELLTTMVDKETAASLEPYSFSSHVFRRGDPVPLIKDNEGDDKEVSLIVYFNQYWRKNDYGEMLFYDDQGEPFAIVSPKYNRVVLWDSSIGYIMKPPSMDFKQGMVCLKVRFSSRDSKLQEARRGWLANAQEKTRVRESLFSGMEGSGIETLQDVASCLTANYTTLQGKRVYVFDGLFSSNDLMKLRAYVPKHGKFFFDDSLDLDSDNVQWISGFSIDNYTQGPMWPATQKVAAFVSGTDQWYPYDISCNLLRTYDYTRIHEDCEVGEKEWTFLVYLTHDWSEDKYGETTFLHFHAHDSEHLISVLPRFGRVVIFEGIIPHSARPPSPSFKDARLTFVVKLSVNEWVGRTKSLKTEYGHEESMHQAALHLIKNYHNEHFEENYREMLLENAQELREINSALNERFKDNYLDNMYAGHQGEADEDDDEEEDDGDYQHHHHHLMPKDDDEDDEGLEYDENPYFEGEMYPEVSARRNYIYGLFNDPHRDIERLREHYWQFVADKERMQGRYEEQVRKLI